MRARELPFALDPQAAEPLFLQLARAIVQDVRRGRLRPGDRLPGSRSLALSLGVHRNTVLAALQELTAQGWLRSAPAQGTYITSDLPDITPLPRRRSDRREDPAPRLGFDLPALPQGAAQKDLEALEALDLGALAGGPPPAGTLPLLGGLPDLRLLPTAALARAYRRAVRGRGAELLGYDDPRGDAVLRAALARLLSARRGLGCGAEGLLVTRGSQMALYLLAQTLLRPGDVVAVEALGYRPAWAALRLAGARLVPVPVDESGLSVSALAALCEQQPVRALYLTPHHQYPTTAPLSPARRLLLLELARARRLAVLEDDYDHEFHYEGRPLLPLASADEGGSVVYVGTLSKLLAPGLRIGFVVAAEPLLRRLAALRMVVDRQGDHAVQRAVAELLDDGEVERHAFRARGAYHARRDALATALQRHVGGALSFTVPQGGMALWARVAADVSAEAWAAAGRARGVVCQEGRRFAFHGRRVPYLRLGFACLGEAELDEAARRLALALPEARRGG